jgi:hypothetical protein
MDLDIAALRSAPVAADPFPYAIVPDFLRGQTLAEVCRDFPVIRMPGLFPPEELTYGPGFRALLDALRGEDVRRAIELTLGVDLADCLPLLTVRGQARARDGQIHRDSEFKRATLILYLNPGWEPAGGRLRLLRSPTDIEDYAAEVPPEAGLLVAFRCTERAWHGHKPVSGPRRYVMMNYVADHQACRREHLRHRLSAKVKKVKALFSPAL